jgi:hypothetical protein
VLLGLWLPGIAAVAAAPAVRAQEMPDRSKPTNLYTTIETNAEWQQLSGGDRYGIRIMANKAFGEAHQIQVEVPFGWTEYDGKASENGFGDLRLRYFVVPYRRPEARLFSVGASVDVTAPVGSVEDGLGSGAWHVIPGIMAGLRLDDTGAWSLFGVVSYQYSIGEAACAPGGSKPGCGVPSPPSLGGEKLQETRGLRLETFVSAALPWDISGFLWPTLDMDLEGNTTAFNVRLNVEKMFTPRHGIGIDLLREFEAREALQGHVRVSYIYVFGG